LQGTFTALEARAGQLGPKAGADVQTLLAARGALLQRIEQFSAGSPQALKTRHHGDYHLAQVLLAKNDFIIIDFEGEPGRSFDERRAKQSPLRDVAGMLRSFSYARLSALADTAQTDDELQRLAPLADEWERQARAAFLRSYDWIAGRSGLYDSLEPGRGLLGLFELEKALYELRYELLNRPDWLRVPLQGLLALAAAD